ncbi:MAG: CsbD family protein [Actinomycetota bacterium]|nr:CsbD family protein [Actinomycetota bacterium]
MDSDRIEGKAKEVEGQVTGDESREAEGKAQGAWGETKDKADDAWEGVKDKVGDVVDGDDDDKTSEADRP